MLLVHRFFGRFYQYEGNDKCNCIKNSGHIQYVRKGTGFADNEGAELVAGKPCESPCGESKAVNLADALHAEAVGKQSRKIAETAAVSCIDYTKKCNGKENNSVVDAVSQYRDSGKCNGQDKNQLIDSIPVFQLIGSRRKTKPSSGVENSS